MHVVIRFIGLILLYQAEVGAPHRAIIPKYEEHVVDGKKQPEKFCGQTILEHRPFIRVSTKFGGVADDAKWPKFKNCHPGLDCVVYGIPDDTTLSIDAGFAFQAGATEPVPCLVPDFTTEAIAGAHPRLHGDALTTRSAVDYVLPAGYLTVSQFANDQIYTELTIRPPRQERDHRIHIFARPRSGKGKALELVLKPGTTVDIVSAPPDHVTMDYNTKSPADNQTELELKKHFFFLRKLLDVVDGEACTPFDDEAPDDCGNQLRSHRAQRVELQQTHNIGCGNGRMSPDTPGQ